MTRSNDRLLNNTQTLLENMRTVDPRKPFCASGRIQIGGRLVRKRSKSSSRAIEFSWNNCIEERVARVPRLLDVRDARRTPQKLNNGIPLYSRYSQTEVEIIREAELRPCTTGLDLSPSSVVPTIPPPSIPLTLLPSLARYSNERT